MGLHYYNICQGDLWRKLLAPNDGRLMDTALRGPRGQSLVTNNFLDSCRSSLFDLLDLGFRLLPSLLVLSRPLELALGIRKLCRSC